MSRCANHSRAKFWRRVLLPVIERYRDHDIQKYFRGDAEFAIPVLYRLLEQQSFHYPILIPANKFLKDSITHLLTRPPLFFFSSYP